MNCLKIQFVYQNSKHISKTNRLQFDVNMDVSINTRYKRYHEETEIKRESEYKQQVFWASVTFRVCRSVMLPAQNFSLFCLQNEISMSCATDP